MGWDVFIIIDYRFLFLLSCHVMFFCVSFFSIITFQSFPMPTLPAYFMLYAAFDSLTPKQDNMAKMADWTHA